jgi:hypothetical protein
MSEGVRHPFSGALYEPDGDLVRVTAPDGRIGRFRRDGRWVDGEVREADPELCVWVGGPRYANSRVGSPTAS